MAHAAAGARLSDRLLRRVVREGPRGPLRPEPRLLPRLGRDLRRRARGPRHLVAGDRGREVLARRPQRPAPPRRPRRPDQLRRRPQGVPRGDRSRLPGAWVQTCIVHLIRASLRYFNYGDRKKVTSALRAIYLAPNAEAAL